MSTLDGLHARLETQLDTLDLVPGLAARVRGGDWSARENLAHLARHATVFLERLARILTEDSPRVGRYRAEDDPDWPRWSDLPLDETVHRLRDVRARLIA